jgi:nucleotide-binding universal stress UspA family protein
MTDNAADIPPAVGRKAMRLLVPVDATERSRWGVEYALRQHRDGRPVEACLLFVAEPVTRLEVLRFRTHDEIARFQAESGRLILQDAARPLREAGIAGQEFFREGDIVFQILDTAEQLGCDAIVLPLPHARIARLLARDVVREVLRQTKGVPVVAVDAEGTPSAP